MFTLIKCVCNWVYSIFNIWFYLSDWLYIFIDFSLKNFLESQGGKLVEFLPTTVSSLLMKTLGIDQFLLSTPCLKSSASSIQVQGNFSSSGMFYYVFIVLLPTISQKFKLCYLVAATLDFKPQTLLKDHNLCISMNIWRESITNFP